MQSPIFVEPTTTRSPFVARATTHNPDSEHACAELVDQLGSDVDIAMVFFGDGYDHTVIEQQLGAQFSGTVVGATTSGIIGRGGFSDIGMSAIGFREPAFSARTFCIDDLHNYGRALKALHDYVDLVGADLKPNESIFGILLLDGLVHAEERITAAITHALGHVPLIGGSAGDHLRFKQTSVFCDGRFRQGVAAVTIIRSEFPISIFQHQHHKPSATTMVVTEADPDARRVMTINGLPAADAYAQAVDVPVAHLADDLELFAAHPLLLRAGERSFIRSVQSVNDDGSLQFLCAIDEGLVLRIGEPDERLDSLKRALREASEEVGGAAAILAFDCVLRRGEFQRADLQQIAGDTFDEANAIGFSTYGEQFGALHMNQTLVGVAIGSE